MKRNLVRFGQGVDDCSAACYTATRPIGKVYWLSEEGLRDSERTEARLKTQIVGIITLEAAKIYALSDQAEW